MSQIRIEGPNRLRGKIRVQGAKNSTLPLLAASLLIPGETVLLDCPVLSDVEAAMKIINNLGASCRRQGDAVLIDSRSLSACGIPHELMREMRSSIVFLGAILSRMGKAELSFPGGCEIGARPIDLHLSSLKKLGAQIEESHGVLYCTAPGGLRGANINLSFPSVGATENIILAAVVSKGTTVIQNAAKEPEIADLASFLNRCGGKIRGAGESCVVIEGVDKLSPCQYRVMPDRIEAATYMAACAMCGGELLLENSPNNCLTPLISVFEESGCSLRTQGDRLCLSAPGRLHSVGNIRTMPYPGFPTDAQAPIMAMCCLAEGTTVFVETIFESRYKHTAELLRLGAHIKVADRVAVVEGVRALSGAPVTAHELRGGAALVCAGLAAQGVTTVSGVEFIRRGYEDIVGKFRSIGAKIDKTAILQ